MAAGDADEKANAYSYSRDIGACHFAQAGMADTPTTIENTVSLGEVSLGDHVFGTPAVDVAEG